jgi:hypothetical protein
LKPLPKKTGIAVGVDGIFIETHFDPAMQKRWVACLHLDCFRIIMTKLVAMKTIIHFKFRPKFIKTFFITLRTLLFCRQHNCTETTEIQINIPLIIKEEFFFISWEKQSYSKSDITFRGELQFYFRNVQAHDKQGLA